MNSSSHWSPAEKKVARRAFDKALQAELAHVMHTAKSMAADAKEPQALWDLEDFLRRSRRSIDQKYDYRYSMLELVLARLVAEQWISMEDLNGLSDERIRHIERMGSL